VSSRFQVVNRKSILESILWETCYRLSGIRNTKPRK